MFFFDIRISKPIPAYVSFCCTSVVFIISANRAHAIRGAISAFETWLPWPKDARPAATANSSTHDAPFLFLTQPYTAIHTPRRMVVNAYILIASFLLALSLTAIAHESPKRRKRMGHITPKAQARVRVLLRSCPRCTQVEYRSKVVGLRVQSSGLTPSGLTPIHGTF